MSSTNVTAKAQIKSHRDLIVWQKAMDLVVSVYRATEGFPKTEVYGLTSQIRRAVTSIPANIGKVKAVDSQKSSSIFWRMREVLFGNSIHIWRLARASAS